MKQDILKPQFWAERLKSAPMDALHHAVFQCPIDVWDRIEARHIALLKHFIHPTHSVLDAGCAYGRLVRMLPEDWQGGYLGIDLSPDFIRLAKKLHPNYSFKVGDIRDTGEPSDSFDWAVLISIRPMVIRHLGEMEWKKVETEMKRVAARVLLLEYDEHDKGEVLS
jgi:SAM-dependent methyltransferase